MDLNPESVDINQSRVKIEFTDSEGDKVLCIYLSEKDAWELHNMLNYKLNMKYKRSINEKTLNVNF